MSGVSKRKETRNSSSDDVFSELDRMDQDEEGLGGLRLALDKMQRSYGVVQSLLDVSTSLASLQMGL